MPGIEAVNNQNFCYQIIADQKNVLTICLASLVFAAGSATVGFAIAGYLPHGCLYLGTAVIAVDCVVASVIIALRLCPKKNAQASVQGNPAVTIQTLPDEVLLPIFQQLSGEDLANVRQVCPRWKKIADEPTLCSKFLEAQDWREQNPNYTKAVEYLKGLKSTEKPDIQHVRELQVSNYSYKVCSGNHLVTAQGKHVEVWRLSSQSGRFFRQYSDDLVGKFWIYSIGYFAEVLYIGCVDNMIIVQDNINKTTSVKQVPNVSFNHISVNEDKIWIQNVLTGKGQILNKEFALLQALELEPLRKGFLYKDKLITYNEMGRKNSLDQDISVMDLTTKKTERILSLNARKGGFFNTSNYINEVQVVNGILFAQKINEGRSGNNYLIFRYDLEEKKWLDDLKINEEFLCALAGLVITRNEDRDSNSCYNTIWDFRPHKVRSKLE